MRANGGGCKRAAGRSSIRLRKEEKGGAKARAAFAEDVVDECPHAPSAMTPAIASASGGRYLEIT
jgi:hypothetical protein